MPRTKSLATLINHYGSEREFKLKANKIKRNQTRGEGPPGPLPDSPVRKNLLSYGLSPLTAPKNCASQNFEL